MIVFGLCGCKVELEGGLVLSAETCSWCIDLALLNVQLARRLQERTVRGREAGEAVLSPGFLSQIAMNRVHSKRRGDEVQVSARGS